MNNLSTEKSNESRKPLPWKFILLSYFLGIFVGGGWVFLQNPYKEELAKAKKQLELNEALGFSLEPANYEGLMMQLADGSWDGRGTYFFRFHYKYPNQFETRLKSCGGYTAAHLPKAKEHSSDSFALYDYDFESLKGPTSQFKKAPKWWDVGDKQTRLVDWKRRKCPLGHMVWVLQDRAHQIAYIECEASY